MRSVNLAIALIGCVAATANAQLSYSVVDPGRLGGGYDTSALAINNAGHVVGGAMSHGIVTPASPAAYTANFVVAAAPVPSRVVAWGLNGNGQLGFADDSNFRPDAVFNLGPGSGVTQIAAGTLHSLALKSDGLVWAWGRNASGQLGDGSTDNNRLVPVQAVGLGSGSGVVAIAAGSAFSMALKSDGAVLTWGSNQLEDGTPGPSRLTPTAVSGLGAGSARPGAAGHPEGLIAIAAGATSAYALKSDGTVLAWGNNDDGRLGDGTTTQRLTPVQVSGLGPGSGVIAIAAASEAGHVLALKSNGAVVAWGNNAAGQLGDGTTTQQASPVAVSGLGAGSGVTALATGGAYSLALKSDGSVLSWGSNSLGQLGDGTFTPARFTPVPVSGLGPGSGVIAITAGGAASMALKSDGTALSWGSNSNGQLGSDAANACCSATPLLVTGLAGGTRLAAGNNHALAVTSSGGVLSWGQNGAGQLGKNSIDANPFPTGTFGGTVASAPLTSGGSNFSLALKSDGTVRSWGSNTTGQLGDGFLDNTLDGTAVQVRSSAGTGFLTGITAIAAGNTHSVALQSDGTVWTWGNNANGQIGDGTNTTRLLPVQVSGFGPGSGVVAVSAGNNHNLALKLDGSVWAWGGNVVGQLGDGTTTPGFTPVPVSGFGIGSGVVAIAAGNFYSLAMKADGTVWAWGPNLSGQLGDGTLLQKLTPVQVKDPTGTGFLTNVTAIAADDTYLYFGTEHGITRIERAALS